MSEQQWKKKMISILKDPIGHMPNVRLHGAVDAAVSTCMQQAASCQSHWRFDGKGKCTIAQAQLAWRSQGLPRFLNSGYSARPMKRGTTQTKNETNSLRFE